MRSVLMMVLLSGLVAALMGASPAPAAGGVDDPGGIGDPAAAALAPIRRDGARVGRLVVERSGDAIVATATFRRRPPRQRVTLCVTVGGDRRCVRRRPGADGAVRLKRTGSFVAVLRARVRAGQARGSLRM
jgi:hypothetical protein